MGGGDPRLRPRGLLKPERNIEKKENKEDNEKTELLETRSMTGSLLCPVKHDVQQGHGSMRATMSRQDVVKDP